LIDLLQLLAADPVALGLAHCANHDRAALARGLLRQRFFLGSIPENLLGFTVSPCQSMLR
jgi:hypothetical protein